MDTSNQIIYTYSKVVKSVRIKFIKELRNKNWAEDFGEIEESLKKLDGIIFIDIDFQNCTWVDPLPILSLLLNLNVALKDEHSIRKLHLPSFHEKDSLLQKNSKDRVIGFFLSEGFLDQFSLLGFKLFLQDTEISIEEIKDDSRRFTSHLLYQDSCILPGIIYNFKKISHEEFFHKEIIKDILNRCNDRINIKVSHKNYESVKNTIRNLLIESVANIFEHAYPDSDNVSFGLYIRYRTGLTNPTISSDSRKTLSGLFNKEFENSPSLNIFFPESVDDFIEIFVIDVGVGFAKSFLTKDIFENEQNKFKKAWNESVIHGVRNSKNLKTTNFGGLYVLSKIIKKGFLLCRDESEWIGDFFPLKETNNTTNFESIRCKKNIQGFSFICRLTWDNTIGVNNKFISLLNIQDEPLSGYTIQKNKTIWSVFIDAVSENFDIYKKYYQKSYNQIRQNLFYLEDYRFSNLDKLLPITYLKNKNSENYILLLPNSGQNKHEIHRHINDDFLDVSNPSETLIIADIPVSETSYYLYSLNNAIYKKEFLEKCNKIILVSQNLTVLVLKKAKVIDIGFTFIEDTESSINYIKNITEKVFSPDKSFSHLIEWLRTHDSIVFWRNIFLNEDHKEYFSNGTIKWYRERLKWDLQSYFNFARTLTNDFSLNLYNIALTRSSCLQNKYGYHFSALDNLTQKIAIDNNLKKNVDYNKKATKLHIGGVYLSGYIEEASFKKGVSKNDYSINFFYNQSTKASSYREIAHFFIWPNPEFILLNTGEGNVTLERVGYTSIVAPYGWKYLTIPRYCITNKKTGEVITSNSKGINIEEYEVKALTHANPKETYLDLQESNLITFGHFSYKHQHDFIRINIPEAFNQSLDLLAGFGIFILSEITAYLNIVIDDLLCDENIKNKVKLYFLKYSISKKTNPDPSIIVYPYHFSSDYIIKIIKNFIPTEKQKLIIPLIRENKDTNQSIFLISPQTIEKIKDISKRFVKPSALIFDTSVVSRKTITDIEHILKLCGINEVYSLTILERNLIPFFNFEWEKNKSYYRLDVPKLGLAKGCQLCLALKRLDELKKVILSDSLLKRIDQILKNWGVINRYDGDYSNHGLTPTDFGTSDLLKTKLTKSFSIYIDNEGNTKQIGGDKNKIEIINSNGATIYCMEIHAMTTRDNICLKICELEDIPIEAKMQILACNLILFNNEFSYSTKQAIVALLFNLLKEIPESSNYSAIASLALISESTIHEEDLEKWLSLKLSTKFEIKNTDLIIFLCEFAERDISKKLKYNSFILRLKISSNTLKEITQQFHRELYNDFGQPHATPLHYYFKEDNLIKSTLFDAYNSVLKLNELLNKFYAGEFNDAEFTNNILAIKRAIKENIDRIIKEYEIYANYTENEFNIKREEIKSRFNPLFELLKTLYSKAHQGLYIHFDLTTPNEFIFKDSIQRLIDKYNDSKKNIEIAISKRFNKIYESSYSIFERWIPWNKSIIKEILYLFDNCKHVKYEIFDPYSEKRLEKKKIWVTLEYKEDPIGISVQIINRITDKSEYDRILSENKKKFKPHQENIKSLGGEISYDCEEYLYDESVEKVLLLYVKINLPFV